MKIRFTMDTGDHITLTITEVRPDRFGWIWVDGIGVNLARVKKMQAL
jgi:hypothetical protein